MLRPRRQPTHHSLIRGVVLSAMLALAAGAGAERVQAAALSWAGPSDPRRDDPTQLEIVSAVLFDLEAPALADRAEIFRQRDERTLIAAMVLRAGRAVPPGVGAARVARREQRSAEAVAWLRNELSTESGRALVTQILREALGGEERDARSASRPLRAAAVESVVLLDLIDLAPDLARLLGDGVDPELAALARSGLRRLTGHDLRTGDDFERLWSDLSAQGLGPRALLFSRGALLEAQARADRARLQLVAAAPARLEGSPFDVADPELAADVARSIAAAVGEGLLAPDAARALLANGIADEHRPVVLHARVQALLDLIQGADPASDEVAAARAMLRELCGGRAEDVWTVSPSRAWVALAALPRLVRGEGGVADSARILDLQLGAALFDALLASTRDAPLDPDGLEGAIASLIDLARGISDDKLRTGASRGFVLDLNALVPKKGVVPLGVRRAAARGLRLSIEPLDAQPLLQLMRTPGGRELEYELLGALREAISVLDPASDQAGAITDALFEALKEEDYDARSQALSVLLSEDVAPTLAARDLERRTKEVLDEIATEPSGELRIQLVHLAGRIGDATTANAFLGTPRLMALCRQDGTPFVEALARALASLGEGDAALLLKSSRALMDLPLGLDEPEGEERLPLRASLLREALRLDLAATNAATEPLPKPEHLRALRATLELTSLGSKIGVATPDSLELLRLSSAHALPVAAASEPDETHPVYASRAVQALAGAADAVTWPELDPSQPLEPAARVEAITAILAHFDAAAALAPPLDRAGARRWSRADLELEAVRFLVAAGRRPLGLERFDLLVDRLRGASAGLPAQTAREYVDEFTRSTKGLDAARTRRIASCLEVVLTDAKGRMSGGQPDPADVAWLTAALDTEPTNGPTLRVRLNAAGPEGQAVLESIDDWAARVGDDDSNAENSEESAKSP